MDQIDGMRSPFDMIFLDADKKSYPEYLRLSLQLSRVGMKGWDGFWTSIVTRSG
ncbi:hypothetical protein [Paraburkholderia rhynchosiae]|uniref:Uncharacterized protein n=1 Tax=Paraburkholderia rhynchosiae TaxID=487049 RepID=A0A6J5AYP1_9BURK|nr:hypothetical protein LMG27174_02837 [Paraburkholderia rhynchosiae]